MTGHELASTMRRIADVVECVIGESHVPTVRNLRLSEEAMLGAAMMLCYLRDLLTPTREDGKNSFSRGELLHILETISRDPELFTLNLGVMIWQMEDTDEDEGVKGK